MSSAIEKLTEVLALPAEPERILDQLAMSLRDDAETAFQKNWATEAILRRGKVGEGRVKTNPGDEALARVCQSVTQ